MSHDRHVMSDTSHDHHAMLDMSHDCHVMSDMSHDAFATCLPPPPPPPTNRFSCTSSWQRTTFPSTPWCFPAPCWGLRTTTPSSTTSAQLVREREEGEGGGGGGLVVGVARGGWTYLNTFLLPTPTISPSPVH